MAPDVEAEAHTADQAGLHHFATKVMSHNQWLTNTEGATDEDYNKHHRIAYLPACNGTTTTMGLIN